MKKETREDVVVQQWLRDDASGSEQTSLQSLLTDDSYAGGLESISCPICLGDSNAHITRVDVHRDDIDYVFDAESAGHPRAEHQRFFTRGIIVMITFGFEHCHHTAAVRFQFHKGDTFVRCFADPHATPPENEDEARWPSVVWRD